MTGILNMLVGSGGGSAQLFVEDVFSTWLYTGNGGTQTITNGINLSGQGGLVWAKSRSGGNSHILTDTARGVANTLATNWTGPQNDLETNALSSFNSNGFGLNNSPRINVNGEANASWTFREAPKFFDIVTYTGNGVAGRQIAHNLGVAPGMIIVKRLNNAENWDVYHRSVGATGELRLNQTAAISTSIQYWNDTEPTASVFTVGINSGVNANGGTYVAYLFAHDTTADGVIQCGSYTGNGSSTGPVVTLGWEPQWLLIKRATGSNDFSWMLMDNMRGMPVGGADAFLSPNNTEPEYSAQLVDPTATGFSPNTTAGDVNANGSTYIYVAIRRGPMRTPTLGTSVFAPVTRAGTSATTTVTSGSFPPDFLLAQKRSTAGATYGAVDRLRGRVYLNTPSTEAEQAGSSSTQDLISFNMNGYTLGTNFYSELNVSGINYVDWVFQRAPGFFDEVCYTGTGANGQSYSHNLGVAPELMIVKKRSSAESWGVLTDFTDTTMRYGFLESSSAVTGPSSYSFGNILFAKPTASSFTLRIADLVNTPSSTYVAYLFASCPGVSKVGSYTGNGSSQTINCAFTTGARFVLIKRTDSTGDWYVWDSARGIVAGNDPYLALNTTAAEVTTNDSVDTDNTGFVVNQVAASNINVNAATYIFLAVA